MDKPFIKWVLILAFVSSLVFVFASSCSALRGPSLSRFELPAQTPQPPPTLTLEQLDFSKPEQIQKQLERINAQVTAYGHAATVYESTVAAYSKDVEARTTAWKAINGDPASRVDAFKAVVTDTLGPLIVTPLLGALLLYAGIKVTGDVAAARATGRADARVASP